MRHLETQGAPLAQRLTFTITEVAERCGVSRHTVYKWVRNGLAVSRPVGGDMLIKVTDLDEFLERAK